MKASAILAIGLAWAAVDVTFVSLANASDDGTEVIQPSSAQAPSVDCSKETWPNFSPACLRNTNSTAPVRIVAVTRR